MVYNFFQYLLILLFSLYHLGQSQVPPTYGGDYTMPQSQVPSNYAGDYTMPQPQIPSSYGADYNIPQPQTAPSQNTFFSPQTAFYAPSSQQQMSSNQAMPGMEYFSNNPLFNVGLNVVEQGMKDITGKTVNMLPNEVKTNRFYFRIYLI
jgi:hypothetical protein